MRCAHDNNQLVFSQCVGKLPLHKLDDRIQCLVSCEQWLVTLSAYQWNSLIEKLP